MNDTAEGINTTHLDENNDVQATRGWDLQVPREVFIIANGVNGCLIILGNLLVIVAICRQKNLWKSTTNHFIASLSISDSFVGLIFIPFKVAAMYKPEILGMEHLCDAVMTISWTSMNTTVLSLLSIAIDRYRAIVTPLKQRISVKQARLIILLTWIVSFGYSSVNIYLYGVVNKITEQNVTISQCKYVAKMDLLGARAATDGVILYIAPLVIIAYLYIRMVVVLYFGSTLNETSKRRKRKAIKMLIIIVVMFAVCWLPIRIWRMFMFYIPRLARSNFIFTVIILILFANSWINPVILAFFSEKFRSEFTYILSCGCRRQQFVQKSTSDNRMRNVTKKESGLSDTLTSITLVVGADSLTFSQSDSATHTSPSMHQNDDIRVTNVESDCNPCDNKAFVSSEI
ncbi:QRFP-like peptide receptor [Glandiceps talaboti]